MNLLRVHGVEMVQGGVLPYVVPENPLQISMLYCAKSAQVRTFLMFDISVTPLQMPVRWHRGSLLGRRAIPVG